MSKFRKKPVVINAMQWTGTNQRELSDWTDRVAPGSVIQVEVEGPENNPVATGLLVIPTLEGDMEAQRGDWIICGIKNELYPCNPDVFEKSYEPVSCVNDTNGDGDCYLCSKGGEPCI